MLLHAVFLLGFVFTDWLITNVLFFGAVTIETLTPHTVPLDSTNYRKSVNNSTENTQ